MDARVAHAEAEKTHAQQALAKMETETEQRITAGRDELIDLAMYYFWEYNQGANIFFLKGEAEGLLKKWKARLEEEKETQSITAS